MKKKLIVATIVAGFSLGALGTVADAAQGNGNANGHGCTLNVGGEFDNPGAMFQYLRTRTDADSGNPKDIVEAYPNSFVSVGDLVAKKCGN